MNTYASLFLFVTGPKTPVPPGQFEFSVDRVARRIVTWRDLLATKELVRVQTGRQFKWSARMPIADRQGGGSRPIPCLIVAEGSIDSGLDAARTALEGALPDNFDTDVAFNRVLADSIIRRLPALGSSTADVLLEPGGSAVLAAHMVSDFRMAKLPVTSLTIRPISYDPEPFRDLEDMPGSLHVRSKDLVSILFGYKARLRWGSAPSHKRARLTYDGSILGKTPGPALAQPQVAGQVQPIEAWFTTLLRQTVAEELWEDLEAGDKVAIAKIQAALSKSLGDGTGRVVESLTLYPLMDVTGRPARRTLPFSHTYPIIGMGTDGLRIDHSIEYELLDKDRWQAQGSPDPDEFFKKQIISAIEVLLAAKAFEAIVAMYLDDHAVQELRVKVETRMQGPARAIGHRMVSMLAILTIPEMDFIHGRPVEVAERDYNLADANMRAKVSIIAKVKVADAEYDQKVFATALARRRDFEPRIRTAIQDRVAGTLRGTAALSYYASSYVNGVAAMVGADGEIVQAPPPESEPLRQGLFAAVSGDLLSGFGVKLLSLELTPGEDALIVRMQALSKLRIERNIILPFDENGTALGATLEGLATVIIIAPDPSHWASFHAAALRQSADQQAESLIDLLTDTLLRMRDEITDASSNERVARAFMARAASEMGLSVHLWLQLTIRRTQLGGRLLQMDIKALHDEYEILLERRREIRKTGRQIGNFSMSGDDDPLTVIDAEIADVRGRIEHIEPKQTHKVETIRIGSKPPPLLQSDGS